MNAHDDTAPAAAELKVIGLGYGRTGTDSLKEALIELGFGPSYHMKELLFDEQASTEGHISLWEAAANGGRVDWAAMLSGYQSGCDFPMAAFPDEMLAAYPNAKFVLTVRPAEKWWSSIQTSICWMDIKQTWQLQVLTKLPFLPFSRMKAQMPMMDAVIKHKAGGDHGLASWNDTCNPSNKQAAMDMFEAHNARIKKLIPPSQLLVFEAGKSSYAELATFLGVPTPSKPYPRSNSKAEFAEITNGLTCAAVAVVVLPLLMLVWISRRGGGVKKAKGA